MIRSLRPERCFVPLALLALAVAAPSTAALDNSWFVSLPRNQVAPTPRSAVTQLHDAGTVDTDGFKNLVISLGGEFKEGQPRSGAVGALLIPDHEIAEYLLRNEGVFVFPIEVRFELNADSGPIFMSQAVDARVAFPRYRVYLYNETASGASVSVFVYRTR